MCFHKLISLVVVPVLLGRVSDLKSFVSLFICLFSGQTFCDTFRYHILLHITVKFLN